MPANTFGHIEARPRGRVRARYTGPDGRRHSKTFPSKADARAWLAHQKTDIDRADWRSPKRPRVTVGEYAEQYLDRADLRESTKALYRQVWASHLKDEWERQVIESVSPRMVRGWHSKKAKSTGPTALVQAYRLLRALFNMAVEDEVIDTNPCRLKGAGVQKSAKRPKVLTASEVVEVAGLMPDRYQAMILLLGFGGLRLGEATALVRSDFSADCRKVTVQRSASYLKIGETSEWVIEGPKTAAGVRTVALPGFVADEMKHHLKTFTGHRKTSLVFPTRNGNMVPSSNITTLFHRATEKAGLGQVRIHWLRHTAATLAAGTGATTKGLMARIGHASPVAALRYQHAVASEDEDIAAALGEMMNPTRAPRPPTEDGE